LISFELTPHLLHFTISSRNKNEAILGISEIIFKNFNKPETSGMFLGVDLSNVYLLDKTRLSKKAIKIAKVRKSTSTEII